MKSVILFLCCFAAIPALAARQCSQGNGSDRLEMPGGYVAQVAASTDKPGQCRASITTQDGKTVYELTDREIVLNPISGKDVNGDGKPDMLVDIQGSEVVFLNDGGHFRPPKPGDHVHL